MVGEGGPSTGGGGVRTGPLPKSSMPSVKQNAKHMINPMLANVCIHENILELSMKVSTS